MTASRIRASLICERVRAQVSLDLDGELSQLERRMLSAHLLRCPECLAFSDEVNGFTHELRSAPFESLEYPVVVRRPGRVALARVQVGVAAALALASVGIATQLGDSTRQQQSPPGLSSSRELSPPRSVLEREQAILQVVRPGLPLPPIGSVL